MKKTPFEERIIKKRTHLWLSFSVTTCDRTLTVFAHLESTLCASRSQVEDPTVHSHNESDQRDNLKLIG